MTANVSFPTDATNVIVHVSPPLLDPVQFGFPPMFVTCGDPELTVIETDCVPGETKSGRRCELEATFGAISSVSTARAVAPDKGTFATPDEPPPPPHPASAAVRTVENSARLITSASCR